MAKHRFEKVDVVIEVPRGSRNKYEWDRNARVIRLDRRIPSAASFPADYGFVPETRASDGDPLDALVLMEGPVYPGVWVSSRPIGVAWVIDDGQRQPKLLFVPADDPAAEHLRDIEDISEFELGEIAQFFDMYKNLQPGTECRFDGWANADEAREVIKDARSRAKSHPEQDHRDERAALLACVAPSSLAVAESCTAGALCASVKSTTGVSEAFRGGLVAYEAHTKFDLLSVTPGPVVTARTASEMAAGVRRLFGTHIGLATTGVLGPETEEGQPVGTLYAGLDADDGTNITSETHLTVRNDVADPSEACEAALDLIARYVAEQK